MAEAVKRAAKGVQSKGNQARGRANGGSGSGEFSDELQHLVSALADRVLSGANDKVGALTEKVSGLGEGSGKAVAKAGTKMAEGHGPLRAGLAAAGESVKSTVSNAFKGGGGGSGRGKKVKVTNIVEQIDVGAPISLVYDQWTQFQEFSNFMKKVENVDQKEDEKLEFKAQVLWSHRSWQATILEQVPDERIIWRSSGDKGRVDGAVTFHELAPDLTRVIVVLEYHPQGLFERTGNLWRAQGRRARLELKHFQRHVMTHTLLHPDDVEGWRGEIHDSKVTKSDEDARAEAESEDDEYEDEEGADEDDEAEDAEDEYDDEAEDDEAEDDEAEDDEAEDAEDEGAEDEYDDEAEDDEAEDDEAEDDEAEGAEDEYDDETEDDEAEDDEAEAEDEGDAEDEYDEAEDEDEAEDDEAEDEDEDDEVARDRRAQRRRRSSAGRRPRRQAHTTARR